MKNYILREMILFSIFMFGILFYSLVDTTKSTGNTFLDLIIAFIVLLLFIFGYAFNGNKFIKIRYKPLNQYNQKKSKYYEKVNLIFIIIIFCTVFASYLKFMFKF